MISNFLCLFWQHFQKRKFCIFEDNEKTKAKWENFVLTFTLGVCWFEYKNRKPRGDRYEKFQKNRKDRFYFQGQNCKKLITTKSCGIAFYNSIPSLRKLGLIINNLSIFVKGSLNENQWYWGVILQKNCWLHMNWTLYSFLQIFYFYE